MSGADSTVDELFEGLDEDEREVGFTEWTEDGKLRHPRFVGLRFDKDPEDVVRESP